MKNRSNILIFISLFYSFLAFSQDYCTKDSLQLVLEERNNKLKYTFINESNSNILIYNYSFYNQYFNKLTMYNEQGIRCHTGGTRWRIDMDAFLKNKKRYLVLPPKEAKSFYFTTKFSYSDLSLFDEYKVVLSYWFKYEKEDFWQGDIESNDLTISDKVLENCVMKEQSKVKMKRCK